MENEPVMPWWRSALNVIGIVLGLLALSGLLMGGILVVARMFDTSGSHTGPAAPVFIDMSSSRTANPQDNARTRTSKPYDPQPWPDTPSRYTNAGPVSHTASRGNGNDRPVSKGPTAPVGISVQDYQEKIASGGKVFLPDPKGDCDLSGQGGDRSSRSLEECFAAQASR